MNAHANTFAQAMAAQYLKSGPMPDTLHRVRQVYAERAKTMGEVVERELGDAVERILEGVGRLNSATH
jgi:2-aminoadipate transaminase